MTTFSYPLEVKRREMDASGAGAVEGKVPSYFQRTVSVGDTGTAVGATTIPLFVVPAGSRAWDATLDVITGYDNTAGVNFAVGVPTSTGIIFAATTVNTEGRRVQTLSGAQVSALAIPFAVDTTVQAVVSITTSVVTTGAVLVNVVII